MDSITTAPTNPHLPDTERIHSGVDGLDAKHLMVGQVVKGLLCEVAGAGLIRALQELITTQHCGNLQPDTVGDAKI